MYFGYMYSGYLDWDTCVALVALQVDMQLLSGGCFGLICNKVVVILLHWMRYVALVALFGCLSNAAFVRLVK